MKTASLQVLFETNKQRLSDNLEGMTIPKDSETIQQNISTFFSDLLLEEGEFRQGLTQSEDYILQAVLAILNAHQARYTCLPKAEMKSSNIQNPQQISKRTGYDEEKKVSTSHTNIVPSVAAGVGAFAGSTILGTWGAVCGAIACTAFAVYVLQNNKYTKETTPPNNVESKVEYIEKSLNVDDIILVIQNLCKSIDDIITTFRAQVNNVIQKYKNIETPTFEQEHILLLDQIQTLVGYARRNYDDEKFIKKILERIDDLAESLENYNLSMLDYNGQNDSYFEIVSSSKVTEIQQVYPAIIKNDIVVKKGKLFTPQK